MTYKILSLHVFAHTRCHPQVMQYKMYMDLLQDPGQYGNEWMHSPCVWYCSCLLIATVFHVGHSCTATSPPHRPLNSLSTILFMMLLLMYRLLQIYSVAKWADRLRIWTRSAALENFSDNMDTYIYIYIYIYIWLRTTLKKYEILRYTT